jgi:hypothetical protein
MTARARRLPVVLALASWVCACQTSSSERPIDSTAAGINATVKESASGARVSAVRLERQPCFGTCPVYTLDVDSTGRVRFQGRKHVRVVGAANATIGRDAFRTMTAQLMEAGFPSFDTTYVAGTQECGDHVPDLPVVVLSAVIDGVAKQVVHDYGCSGAPRALRRLHQMIDSVANTSQWLLDSRLPSLNG